MIYPLSNYTIYSNSIKCSGAHQSVNGSCLTVEQRVSFSVVVLILMLLAIITNTSMVYVAFKNDKNQTFFRISLISLACSDLMSSILTGVNYSSQYITQFNNIWTLGSLSCKVFPLLITAAILANGFTLVGISFSRYLAIRNLTRSNWESSQKICLMATFLIWGSSMGIASPSFAAYQTVDVFILEFVSVKGNEIHLSCGQMCISNMLQNTIYYSVLFGILFVPTFVAFLWFNGVLAREVWKRHRIAVKMHAQQELTPASSNANANDTNPFANTQDRNSSYENECAQTPSGAANQRERHFRMFCVIVLLTLMYLALKLPQWLFIMLAVYNDMTVENVILQQYVFGIMSMLSGVINPILYAFLTQTVKRTIKFYHSVISYIVTVCKRTGIALSSVIEIPAESSE